MTLPVPLTVRLSNAAMDMHIEKELRSLSFRSTAPGGFASATFSLDRPLILDPLELAYYTKVFIYGGSGATVWEGRIEDLGRSVGADGLIWDLAAVGTSAHARDKVSPRIWCDQVLNASRWRKSNFSTKRSSKVEFTDSDADATIPAMQLVWYDNTPIDSNSRTHAMYRAIFDCGQQLGRVKTEWVNGSANANRENRIITRQGLSGAGTTVDTDTWALTSGSLTASRGGANAIPANHDVAEITIESNESLTVGDSAFGQFFNVLVRSILKDINGNDITTGYTNDYVTAAEVVTDLIGRGDLYMVDPASTTIDTTGTAQINQIGDPLGVSPAAVFDALLEFEPGFQWEIWESQSNGKYRLEWKPWPSTIRYEANVTDGIDSPSSAAELYNQALVAYTDPAGRPRTVLSTSSVQALTDAGLTRTFFLDITEGTNSAANAQRAGEQALLEHATPPNAGTWTIARPIYDADRGLMVHPWEILPGYLIRSQGIRMSRDSLNAVTRDGSSVFRIVAVEFDTESASAKLELDAYAPSIARAIADLSSPMKGGPSKLSRRGRF